MADALNNGGTPKPECQSRPGSYPSAKDAGKVRCLSEALGTATQGRGCGWC